MAKIIEVIIPDSIKPRPQDHEIDTAWILARHFECLVEFLQPVAAYKTKSPDIVMNGIIWEMKSPTGKSVRSTVKRQFKGLKQSRNLVIHTGRTKLDDSLIIKQIKRERTFHRMKQIIVITKDGRLLDI